MSKKKIKYVQLEPAAFLSDEDFQMMTDAERGIYCTIIFYMLCNNGRIRNDEEGIKKLCNVTSDFEQKWSRVKSKLYQKSVWLRHRRVDVELRKATEKMQVATKKGIKGATARWQGHSHNHAPAIANRIEGKISKYNIYTNSNIYTLEQCKDAALLAGLTDQDAEEYYHHFNSQGWLKANKQPITNLQSHMTKWRINKPNFKAQCQQLQETIDEQHERLKEKGEI
jgi:uncharacterized protein YdaU (DUF1376 family)